MTTTSRLSSLLVRDGLVRVSRMEHVFQRQVIYGGSLDTILLEMKLVEDHRLQQYLSLATGLPPANGEANREPSEGLTKTCTQLVASKYQVVPISIDDRSLAVLVCDPVDVSKLEGLADELDFSVQPMVVPEYQYRMSFARLYGEETDERFAKLAQEASTSAAPAQAAKQVPVVTIGERANVDEDIDEEEEEQPPAKAAATPESTQDAEAGQAIPQAIEPESTQPADTSERVRGKRAPAEQPTRRQTQELNTDTLRMQVPVSQPDPDDAPKVVFDPPPPGMESNAPMPADPSKQEIVMDLQVRAEAADSTRATVIMMAQEAPVATPAPEPAKQEVAATPEAEETATPEAEEPTHTTLEEQAAATLAAADPARVAAGAAAVEEPEDPYASISPEQARTLLDKSEDRDEIFAILLRAIRKRARHASLFTLKGKTAVGRVALTKAGIDRENIKEISINLEAPSRFQQVLASKAFSVGDLSSTDAGVTAALAQLGGGEVPESALLLPVVMRDRVIAIAVGHNSDRGISVGRVTELLPLGTATADAVSRLLAKMRAEKAQGSGPVKAAPVAAAPATDTEDPTHAVPVADPAMLELFARIESEDQKVSKAAIAEAIGQVDAVIPHLYFGFPGKLARTREESSQRLRASEHGPILDLVTQIGPKCGPALSEKMRDADRKVRYYATLCAAELRPSDVLNEIIERLFDGDEQIRDVAVDALTGYPKEALNKGLEFARRALHSEDNARVKLAAEGLTKLEDTLAIADLIDAHSRGGDAGEVSRCALQILTGQDFGSSNRKWRAWWDKNQGTNRIIWMLEGLNHKNAEIRENASETLRKLTGEYFGYGHDLPKKEREKTRKLWLAWWEQTGQDRYS